MVWIRYARIKVTWKCFTTRGYASKLHSVGVVIRDEYEKRPTDDIDTWAKRLGDFVANKMCENSCQSLSTSVFCDKTSLEIEIVYTSETLVVKEKKLEEMPTIPVPMYILEQIKLLEMKREDTKTKKGKSAIQKSIDEIKRRYGIK